jgi:putative transposase
MDASFCVAALEEALARHGKPEIFNTDQGSQFTGADFTSALIEAGVRISMDGRGRWMDNVFIERLWRSLKHEDIYLKGYADGREAKAGIGAYFAIYNHERPHEALDFATPASLYRGSDRAYPRPLREPDYPDGAAVRRFDRSNGPATWFSSARR